MVSEETKPRIDGLVPERRNSNALAMELRLSCLNPSIYGWRVKSKHNRIKQTLCISTDTNFDFPLAHALLPVNFALGKPVWTTNNGTTDPPSYAVDGNPSTIADINVNKYYWPFLAIDLETNITLITVMMKVRYGESWIWTNTTCVLW